LVLALRLGATGCRVATLSAALALVAPVPEKGARASDGGGTIEGRVSVRLRLAGGPARPTTRDLGSPEPRDLPDRSRTVVYLEVAPQAAFEPPPTRRARMDQRNETFVPYVLAISAGSTVDFPNNDDIYHNVFSLSSTKRFDLGRYAAGHSKSVLFDRPGVVRVFCEIHSHMTAFILVFAHRFFDTTDGAGRYRIEGVPPGTYELAAWTDGEVRATRSVTVPAAGGRVEADFVIE
jgi:plastocyanin